MSMFTIFATGVIVWCVAGHVVMSCSDQAILDKLTKCLSISTNDLIETTADEIYRLIAKSDIECNLKCYLDAIGDCYKQDQFFSYNPEVLKATSRAFCHNQTETMAAFINCQWVDTDCLSNLATALVSALTEYSNGNYGTFKTQYCSALTTVIGCIGFSVTSACTAELAELAEDFYKASFSFTTCGIPKHKYLSTYGGDVTCSGRNLFQSVSLLLLLLCFYFAGIFL